MKIALLTITGVVLLLLLSETKMSRADGFLQGQCKSKRWGGCQRRDQSIRTVPLKRRVLRGKEFWPFSNSRVQLCSQEHFVAMALPAFHFFNFYIYILTIQLNKCWTIGTVEKAKSNYNWYSIGLESLQKFLIIHIKWNCPVPKVRREKFMWFAMIPKRAFLISWSFSELKHLQNFHQF